ncbi:hypothetical protein EDB87DRAFT_1582210 [Lactarius vividus]|nr:hypothetical protein EDB87DRAFT_1582210 [Lactarius vividus]
MWSDRSDQQSKIRRKKKSDSHPDGLRNKSHSLSGEPRTGVVSRLEIQRATAATHFLESRGQASSAGWKHSEPRQPLTNWRAEDRRHQQAGNTASHGSHSPPGEPRTGVVSRLETQRATAATHQLESQGQASSAGWKHSEPRQPLTNWRAEDRRRVVSSLETQRATTATHFLESRGQASSAAWKNSEPRQPLTNWRAEDRRRQQAGNTASHGSHSRTGEPRTGVVSRLETQRATAATHLLESRGQASSAGWKHSEPRQLLTSWRAEDRHRQQGGNTASHGSHSHPGEPRTGVVSRLETQRATAATHSLESRGQESSAGWKHSEPRQPLTSWRAEDRRRQQAGNIASHGSHPLPGEPRTGVISRLETQRATAATHQLESRGQASSVGWKHSEPRQPLTSWRAEDRRRQQAGKTASHVSYSPTGEPRTGVVSRLETQRATAATHFLESRGQASSAGWKHSEPRQPLTNWRADDRRRQQAGNTASHGNHSPTGEPKTGVPLTSWRAEDRRRQQVGNTASHVSHSLPGEPRTGIVSRLETQRATAATHFLESRGQASSAGWKHSRPRQPLTLWRAEDRRRQQAGNTAGYGSHSLPGEPRTGVVSSLETQRATAATHFLESRGQASSAGWKHSEPRKPLTSWRTEDRRRQQAGNTASHGSHSLPGEPRTGVISKLETQRATAATHFLESRGQASSAGWKHSEPRQPLTSWRAEDRRRQQAGKHSEPRQPLTNWRAEDRRRQQVGNTASHGSHSLPGEPRTGVVSRLETQRATAATHSLESRGQTSSAGWKHKPKTGVVSRLEHSEPRQPLTLWRIRGQASSAGWNTASHGSHSLPGEPRTGVVSKLETQRATAATHELESRGQASSAGWKHSEPRQPLTSWRADDRRRQQAGNTVSHGSHSLPGEPKTGVVSRLETQRATSSTHSLESRGQASSAGWKYSEPRQPLTNWSAEDRRHQQAGHTASHGSHSRTGEPRTGVVSRVETQRATAATHFLESRGKASSAGCKHSEPRQPLTSWRAEDRRRQQVGNTASHGSHSLSGEPRTGVVSRLETKQATAATHFLESRGQASSAGWKHSEPRQPLTLWRAEDRRRQQAGNTASHVSHSLSGEPRTGVVSKLETQRATAATHFLKSRGQASSAGWKHSEPRQPLTSWRAEDRRRQQAANTSQGQASSTGWKHSEPRQSLTLWRAEDRRRQQAGKTASHGSHSLSGEPRTGVISKLDTQRATAATHQLESRGQASSVGWRHSEPQQPLTNWRAEDRRRQQAGHTASHGSHSLPGEPKTGVVSRLETQRAMAATHSLESRGQASSAGWKHSEPQPRTGVVSKLETQRATAATHILESRGQVSSAGWKHSEPRQPLTNWRAEDRRRQQAGNIASHGSHSRTGEPRTGVVSRLETQRATAATHFLESRGQASSAGWKHSEPRQPLTLWTAEDKRRQQAGNTASHGSHSHPGERKIGVVSMLET